MKIVDGLTEAVGNTPLIRLRRASDLTGCTILGKAEFLNPGGSVKDRAALYIIRDAEDRGALEPGGLIVEGTAGNTGIGLALVGNARGYRTLIVIPETQSQGEEGHAAPVRRDPRRGARRPLPGPPELRSHVGAPREGARRDGAERGPVGEPVGQHREPGCPRARHRPRDLGADGRKGGRVRVRDRDRRVARRDQHGPQGAPVRAS